MVKSKRSAKAKAGLLNEQFVSVFSSDVLQPVAAKDIKVSDSESLFPKGLRSV